MIIGSSNYGGRLQWRQLLWGSPTARLITINCVVFILVTIANLICDSCGYGKAATTRWLALPGNGDTYLSRPWTIFTYMWVNTDLLRLLFNMLWLLCFGRLLSLPLSAGRFTGLYISGGLLGGALYLAGTLTGWWQGAWLIGPSAAIIAVTVTTAIMLPQLELNMLIIGRVRVIWVALCVLLIYFLDIDGHNLGGNAAHAGGAIAGAIFGLLRLHPLLVKKPAAEKQSGSTSKGSYHANMRQRGNISAEDNRQLDIILDKVKRAGYNALSDDEKRRLFNISSRIK